MNYNHPKSIFSFVKNQKGVMLLSTFVMSFVILTLASGAYLRAFVESRQVEREISRWKSYFAAEAGLQNAMAQIGINAYTGFINTDPVNVNNFQDYEGNSTGSYDATILYPDQADWVIVQSTGNVDGGNVTLEGRVFLDSNLSKYLIFADTANLGLGDVLQLGIDDGVSPEGVSSNEVDRAAVYGKDEITFYGDNINMWGDIHAENSINGNSTSTVHGDAYSSLFEQDPDTGVVINTGVTGNLTVGDGFEDDIDRDSSGTIDASDAPDYHGLSASGSGDTHIIEETPVLDLNFYSDNNAVPALAGSTSVPRYLELEVDPNNPEATRVIEYDNAGYDNVIDTHDGLDSNSIIYVNGRAFVKGEIEGRVSLVSSDDIIFTGDVKYASGDDYVDPTHSAAFLAQDKIAFVTNSVEVSGIAYTQNISNASVALEAKWALNNGNQLYYDRYGKSKKNGHFRLFGNVIMNGKGTTSVYGADRLYAYDTKLKYYRPPGIPVVPELRTVRET